jgi:imidazolonepropionase-like amidohydrolase
VGQVPPQSRAVEADPPRLRADLLLVDGDPSKQIRDTRNIVAIWKRGVRVER